MAFKLEMTPQITFDCLNGLMSYVEHEKKNTSRIAIGGLLSEGACFQNDESFGKDGYALKINLLGMENLCRLLNLYYPMLQQLEKTGLASDVLNDRLNSKNLKDKLNKTQFVFDEPSKTILGVVSESYVGYSNQDFLNDVFSCLEGNEQKSKLTNHCDFEFSTSYTINTHLNLRFQRKSKHGEIRGRGGIADDVSYLGLQISNSMAGGKALTMAYFVHRMLCANGLILPVSGSNARLIHAGHRENFNNRLMQKMNDVIGSFKSVKNIIEQLGDIEFNSEKIHKNIELDKIFSMIPNKDLKKIGTEKLSVRFTNSLKQFEKEERERRKNIQLISDIPYLIGGEHSDIVFKSNYRDNATMFDFINIFTEEAKKYEPAERIQIEKNAGDLADFIAKNKKDFA